MLLTFQLFKLTLQAFYGQFSREEKKLHPFLKKIYYQFCLVIFQQFYHSSYVLQPFFIIVSVGAKTLVWPGICKFRYAWCLGSIWKTFWCLSSQVFWESQKASKRSNVWGIGAPSEGEVITEHQEVISEKSISWIRVENNLQLCWPPVDVEEGFNVIVREKREVGISLAKNHYEPQWITTTIKIMITTTPTIWRQLPCDVVRQSCRSRALVWSDQRLQARWQAPAPPPEQHHECHHPWRRGWYLNSLGM